MARLYGPTAPCLAGRPAGVPGRGAQLGRGSLGTLAALWVLVLPHASCLLTLSHPSPHVVLLAAVALWVGAPGSPAPLARRGNEAPDCRKAVGS